MSRPVRLGAISSVPANTASRLKVNILGPCPCAIVTVLIMVTIILPIISTLILVLLLIITVISLLGWP